jgi:hypothetical protein
VSGALNSKGASHAADTQAKTAANALALATSTEAERKREWDVQQQAAQAQYAAKQAQLAPFNTAAYSVLAKYGVPISQMGAAPPPVQSMPANWQPGMPLPGAAAAPGPTPVAAAPQLQGISPAGAVPQNLGQMMAAKPLGAFDWQSAFGSK